MKDQFAEVLAKAGIFKQTTSPYSPQQNARAERYNLTIAEMVRTFLISSGLPKHLWPFAVLYAVYIKNRLPHSGIGGAIPHELFYEKEVEYESIHTRTFAFERRQVWFEEPKRSFRGCAERNERLLCLRAGHWQGDHQP